ncbi:MAG TPA: SGNH/GDSL hydrolase family protein [Microbacteriaceae bacterium]|nr:SGNH/GDSL hydrolase family protein [Microbacteriaceae bacterium]
MTEWKRYVAIGDSFTEGVGDPHPVLQGVERGWADRVAEVLSGRSAGFGYANLAIRGRLIRPIIDEQLEPAIALRPDLVTFAAGGNDVIRPRTDPDEIAARFELATKRLVASGATVVVFTGVDVGFSPVFRRIRGKVAVYNENIRAIAKSTGAVVADMWALDEVQDARLWTEDRLHMNALGHLTVARMVLETLGVEHGLSPAIPEPASPKSWRQARGEDAVWAKEYLGPWIKRRVTGASSGDGRSAKRATLAPISAPD